MSNATPVITVVDLFCGGGGFSTGLVRAVIDRHRRRIAAETGLDPDSVDLSSHRTRRWLVRNVRVVAVNHWDRAVETYRANHPWATVHNAKVQALHPPDAVGGADVDVDVLIAGPSCIPHSPAKGGMATHDQKRMGPRHVAHWLELLRPAQFLLENVPAFRKWGPLERDQSAETGWSMRKDGSLFDDWVETLRALGYTVEWETFVAADYGDPQTRKRLFVQGRLEHEPAWPAPTHSPDGSGDTAPYRGAAEIIDWSDTGASMWAKSRPLSQTTNARIARGIREFCPDVLAPIADAMATLTPEDVRRLQADAVPVDEAAAAARRRDDAFLVEAPGAEAVADNNLALCPAFVMGQGGGSRPRRASDPVPTVPASGGVVHSMRPLPFVLPRLQRQRGDDSNPAYDARERPCHTITAKNHDGHVFHPFVVNYQGAARGVDEPVPTVMTSDTLALCVPEAYPWGLDVHYRLLEPRETKQAQGFPGDYELVASTKEDKRKLIGNAVPVGLAASLCRTLLEPTDAPTLNKFGETPRPATEATVTGGATDDD